MQSNFIKGIIKGVLLSLIFSLVFILIFGLIISIFDIANGVIKPVNQLIKIIAIFIGTTVAVKGDKGLLKGCLVGFIIVVFLYLFFTIISKEKIFSYLIIWEILLGVFVGGISGIISVNLKK